MNIAAAPAIRLRRDNDDKSDSVIFIILQLYDCGACPQWDAKGYHVHLAKGLLAAIALIAMALPAVSAELVMYRRPGCPYCAAFDREIAPAYPKTEIGRKLPLREVDIHRAPDKSVALKSPIRYTPTFVLVEDGQEKARIEGYPGEFFFWPRLENLLP
jgi:thiol-disulfide isomerase/thioredoxin